MLNLLAIALIQVASYSSVGAPSNVAKQALTTPTIAASILPGGTGGWGGDIAHDGGTGGWGGDIALDGGTGGWGGDIALDGGTGGWGGDIALDGGTGGWGGDIA